MAEKATMTLNLTPQEMSVLVDLASKKGITKTAMIRQCLRLYQLVDVRLANGETMSFSGDSKKQYMFLGDFT